MIARTENYGHGWRVLLDPVPATRWPFGPPEAHEPCCRLHSMRNQERPGGLYCDCSASDASDRGWGVAP